MINSLCKDSHITRSLSYSQKLKDSEMYSGKNKRKEYSNVTVNNIGINKPAEPSFCGLVSYIKNFDVYRDNNVKTMLKFAGEYQPIFSAAFALLLTCLLRPATIMALPSEKKNIDDKKYAAAQSISSGIIGFVISSILARPIGDAIKKVLDKPGDFLSKNAEKFGKGKSLEKVANNYLNQTTEIITAVPKATVTIALVPVILKYVFGLSNKKNDKDFIGQNFTALNFKSAMHNKNVFQQFTGGNK